MEQVCSPEDIFVKGSSCLQGFSYLKHGRLCSLQLSTLKGRFDLQKKIKTAEANIAAQQAKLAEYMQQAAAVEEDISAAERRLAELRADRSGAEAKLDRMKASVHDEVCGVSFLQE
jgi:septal ring factor EnvC (AmiA/AmiB activator)